jgi:hypothetical protein
LALQEGTAHADPPPYTVSTSGGAIVITAASGFHINHEYPWKLTQGTDPKAPGPTLADKSKFTLEDGVAKLPSAPKGTNTLKGAYCAVGPDGKAGSCSPFSTTVTVP